VLFDDALANLDVALKAEMFALIRDLLAQKSI
jgi:ABC-type thiamine transport system ATPase subunit